MHIYEERATKVEEQGRQALSPTIRLHANDDVVIARHHLPEGATLPEEDGLAVSAMVPAGHKVATRRIAAGQPVRRYNQIIGVAKVDIEPGQHVHTHNLAMSEFARDYAFAQDAKPTDYAAEPATFMGIVRPDGRVATRNYVGILSSVNCSATVSRAIADYFRRDIRPEALADYPNVDGVVALTHGYGCAVDPEGDGLAIMRRTLAGYARHPNFAGDVDDRAGVRDQPDRAHPPGAPPGAAARPAGLHHPGHRRHLEDDRARDRAHQGDAARGQQGRRGSRYRRAT